MNCVVCGHPVEAGETFCGNCGVGVKFQAEASPGAASLKTDPLPPTVQLTRACPACGAAVEGADTFCGACGAAVPLVSHKPAAASKNRILLPLLLVGFLFGGAVAGGYFLYHRYIQKPPPRIAQDLPEPKQPAPGPPVSRAPEQPAPSTPGETPQAPAPLDTRPSPAAPAHTDRLPRTVPSPNESGRPPRSEETTAPVEPTPGNRQPPAPLPDSAPPPRPETPTPAQETHPVKPHVEILKPEESAPAPVRPTKPVYSGPSSGLMNWSGEIEKNGTFTIDNGQASAGSVNGSLPGVPVMIEVNTKDFAIVESPSPSNGWRKITLRSRTKKHSVVAIKWTVVQ